MNTPDSASFRRFFSASKPMTCELCDHPGGELLWQNDLGRVVLVDDPQYPGFCRVILNRHVEEMTDLSASERLQIMTMVFAVESTIRLVVQPDKINLASLGNVVPHLHWHIIPRFENDRHFPNSIWGEVKRSCMKRSVNLDQLRELIPANLNS
jgi:diadenosine tetraphosphate (Ap4A) HIT family hydrolase